MEVSVLTIFKELAIATGLGVVSLILGGTFGDVFLIYLLLKYFYKKLK